MAVDAPGRATPGFRAALVFYAGCGLRGHFDGQGYRPYATVLAIHGIADEETSSQRCRQLIERSRALGGAISLKLYPGASHSFDDPGRQKEPSSPAATADAKMSSEALFARLLLPSPQQR